LQSAANFAANVTLSRRLQKRAEKLHFASVGHRQEPGLSARIAGIPLASARTVDIAEAGSANLDAAVFVTASSGERRLKRRLASLLLCPGGSQSVPPILADSSSHTVLKGAT